MSVRSHQTPEAFKIALETRIRAAAAAALMEMERFRQLLVFNRFLARVFEEFGNRAVLKGGMALELRLDRARMTGEVDLRMTGDAAQ